VVVAGVRLRYHELELPLATGTPDASASLDAVLAAQHYELMSWRRADHDLNYRRFFSIHTLAGIRVEVPWGVPRVAS
jgi:(1->4)-alpha-D-glucan 1-alpha-D-glucosylmutase